MKYQSTIQESVESLLELERQTTVGRCRDRVRFIRLLKSGEARSQQQASDLIGISHRQGQWLWKQYLQEGISYLSENQYKGYSGKLSAENKELLQQRLKSDDIDTLQAAQQCLEQDLGVKYKSVSGVSYVLSRLKIKLKTGRPSHVRKDPEAVEAFKKRVPVLSATFCSADLVAG